MVLVGHLQKRHELGVDGDRIRRASSLTIELRQLIADRQPRVPMIDSSDQPTPVLRGLVQRRNGLGDLAAADQCRRQFYLSAAATRVSRQRSHCDIPPQERDCLARSAFGQRQLPLHQGGKDRRITRGEHVQRLPGTVQQAGVHQRGRNGCRITNVGVVALEDLAELSRVLSLARHQYHHEFSARVPRDQFRDRLRPRQRAKCDVEIR